MSIETTAKELMEAMQPKKGPTAYDTQATVTRVDGDTLWVHIPGGVDETPIQRTINASEGDIVQVRVSNGSAFAMGNASAPPTDDTQAHVAQRQAGTAQATADEAKRMILEVENAKIGWAEIDELFAEDITATGSFQVDNDAWKLVQNADGLSIQTKATITAGGSSNVPKAMLDLVDGGFLVNIAEDNGHVNEFWFTRSTDQTWAQFGVNVTGYDASGTKIYDDAYLRVKPDRGVVMSGIGGNLTPLYSGMYSLGTSSYKWNNVWTNNVNGYPPVLKQTKPVSGTTTAAGNISLGLSSSYGILSVHRTDASGICTPYINYSNNTWYAHITNVAASPVAVTNTSVTLEVDYYAK